ncbi:hypothetical protein NEMBOFW57_005644 [Staphylotrichum longicolle]|uniref:Uncharacterized protein n=1 Tax=Staphylotrichum longicolle TaxID=669026 RepID=A0AAD4I1R2_9PEZI|nr:hypothetical protein NEMBOFW57_005644 [Staphylotrichum longicolle]
MAKHNLGLCMLAMGELGKSYISATAAYKLFETAIQKVEKARGCEGQASASVITDVWLPWTNGAGTCETWMDFQNTNEALGNGDISRILSMADWTD